MHNKSPGCKAWSHQQVWVHWPIAPQGVNDWLTLDYLAPALPVPVTYGDWSRVASTLIAGLDNTQSCQFENGLSESLSAALVGYYLHDVADATLDLHSRDDLYRYLLIDNQVSAEITITRIAEAIASVQLYVGRALDQFEPDVDTTVVSRQFFADWTTYNKRYSTWAGVSQLVYYPENYIDPTLRIGQTAMMDSLQQTQLELRYCWRCL